MSITFVTGNEGKLREVNALLDGFDLVSQDIDLPELQGSPEEISREKCVLAVKEVQGPCIVEDTCLCFNALGGPYIKWFLKACGHDGLNKMLAGFDDKTGYAMCVFSYTSGPGAPVQTFVGKTDGKIVPPRGESGFGWDAIFEPLEGGGKTYAEMTKEEKNSISHRHRSVEKLKAYLLAKK